MAKPHGRVRIARLRDTLFGLGCHKVVNTKANRCNEASDEYTSSNDDIKRWVHAFFKKKKKSDTSNRSSKKKASILALHSATE
jgi:hypothetical protein